MSRVRAVFRRTLVSFVLVGASVGSVAHAVPTRADGVAAFIGANTPGPGVIVVLQSDVELRARIELGARGEADPGRAPLGPSELGRAFENLVGEALILREAERLDVAPPTDAAIDVEWQQLFAQLGGAERLDALRRRVAASEDELAEIVRRRAVVRAFVEANLAGSDVVTEAAIERAYAEGDHPFVGEDLDVVREPLRLFLARRAVQEAMVRWIELLRARTQVHVSPSFLARVTVSSP